MGNPNISSLVGGQTVGAGSMGPGSSPGGMTPGMQNAQMVMYLGPCNFLSLICIPSSIFLLLFGVASRVLLSLVVAFAVWGYHGNGLKVL